MTTLVSGDDMPMGRVLPKVFADVPSAEELKQAHETARRARARAGGLMFVTLLLAGALIAALIFIAFALSSSPAGDLVKDLETARTEVQRLKGEETRLTGEAQAARNETQSVRTRFSDLTRIANAEGNITVRRREIDGLIEMAPNANETTVRNNDVGWKAYRRTAKWPPLQNAGDWKSYAAENLETQLAGLDGLKAGIEQFIRDSGGTPPPRPNKPCDTNHPEFPHCKN